QDRFLLDDLVGLPTMLDMEWTNTQTNTIWPLGLQYFKPISSGNLVIGANYTRYMPDYKYNSLSIPVGSVRIASLKDFSSTDWDADLGYQFEIGKSGFFLTPKAGFRWHFTSYELDALTIGTTIGKTIGDNNFEANARGVYAGLGLQYYLQKQVSLIGEYATTSFFPNFGGSMEFKTTEVWLGNGFSALSITNQTSSYEMKIERWMIGAQYDYNDKLHFQAGFRQEQQKHSYPGFFGMNFSIAGSGANMVDLDVWEIITDKIFWESEKTQTKGLFFFAVSYDINM
ncbi:MAG: hypothetical protein H3C43_08865, partial [Leptonema sp. (in: Bacteria)]|nr:hypothetical protein [Leptonema sp. (in: bacteria)]